MTPCEIYELYIGGINEEVKELSSGKLIPCFLSHPLEVKIY